MDTASRTPIKLRPTWSDKRKIIPHSFLLKHFFTSEAAVNMNVLKNHPLLYKVWENTHSHGIINGSRFFALLSEKRPRILCFLCQKNKYNFRMKTIICHAFRFVIPSTPLFIVASLSPFWWNSNATRRFFSLASHGAICDSLMIPNKGLTMLA